MTDDLNAEIYEERLALRARIAALEAGVGKLRVEHDHIEACPECKICLRAFVLHEAARREMSL